MSAARHHIQRHPTGAEIERRLKRRVDRAEAAVTLLFSVLLSFFIALSVVHWLEIGAADLAAEAPAARTGGAS